jgi:hypothetical protein
VAEALGLPGAPPRSTTHSRHLHYIAAMPPRTAVVRTTVAIRTGGGGEQPRPLRPPRLPTPSIPRSRCRRARAHYHRRQIQPPCTTWRRGEGGTGEANQPPRLPLAPPSPHRSQPPCYHRRQKRRGEWGGESCRGLRPSRPPLRTPPFNTSINQKPPRSPHNHHRRSQKGEGGATEATGPPRLPSRRCHCHSTQPLVHSVACTPPPPLDLAT